LQFIPAHELIRSRQAKRDPKQIFAAMVEFNTLERADLPDESGAEYRSE
jgi:hypothetical protein